MNTTTRKVLSKDAPYSDTRVPVEKTKAEIDDVLRKYGVTKIAWTFDPEHDQVELHFQFEEKLEGRTVMPVVSLRPPEIWKSVKGWSKSQQRMISGETVYWPQAMRCLYWYIKSHMEMTRLGYSKSQEFLPHVALQLPDGSEVKVGDVILPRLNRAAQLALKAEEIPLLETEEAT